MKNVYYITCKVCKFGIVVYKPTEEKLKIEREEFKEQHRHEK